MATRHDAGLIAIQCKFLAAEHTIRKEDIDSFISASAKPQFSERMIVETTKKPWSPHAETMLQGQTIPDHSHRLAGPRSRAMWIGRSSRAPARSCAANRRSCVRIRWTALKAVREGLGKAANRGKLIMACGTGKTLTALRIAEDIAGADRLVLFLMPSLALMAQSVREWCADAVLPLATFAVCSDKQVGKRRRSADDIAELEVTDLTFPVTTDPQKVAQRGHGLQHVLGRCESSLLPTSRSK